MIVLSIVLVVVGVLLFALVHPADRNGVKARNVGAGGLILAGLVLLVLALLGEFDAETGDVDADFLVPAFLARWFGWRRVIDKRTGRVLCHVRRERHPVPRMPCE